MKRSAALILIFAAVQCSPTSNSIGGITTGGGGTGTVPAAVNVHDNVFVPPAVTITRSRQIRWTWQGNLDHSVTFDDGTQSQSPKRSGTFTRRFTDEGVFTYYCSVHGRDVMSGTVTVTAAPSP